jgi:hypothetical protein
MSWLDERQIPTVFRILEAEAATTVRIDDVA